MSDGWVRCRHIDKKRFYRDFPTVRGGNGKVSSGPAGVHAIFSADFKVICSFGIKNRDLSPPGASAFFMWIKWISMWIKLAEGDIKKSLDITAGAAQSLKKKKEKEMKYGTL